MMKNVGKLFGIRQRNVLRKAPRVDRRKTRISPIDLDDSDEGSYASTTSVSESESDEEWDSAESGTDSSDIPKKKNERSDDSSETDDEKSVVSKTQRKRSSASAKTQLKRSSTTAKTPLKRSSASANILNDSSSDSDSDVGGEPLRKIAQRKRLKLSDSEDEAMKEAKRVAEVKKVAAKRKERRNKLMELSQSRMSGTSRRMRRTLEEPEEDETDEVENVDKVEDEEKNRVAENDSSNDEDAPALVGSSEEEKQADSDSLKDFIVEDEEKKGEEEEEEGVPPDRAFLAQLPRQFITGSQLTHFQVVVKALLINALDETFLKSLYNAESVRVGSQGFLELWHIVCKRDGERTKRYAQEMKASLHHFDERLVLPRLENLKQRSRWKERYKERVECYPRVRVVMAGVHGRGCEACELHRTGRFCVRLSGQLYHSSTLQEDQFMPDDTQSFYVGSVCASRTEVYHALKHFKYHLFERCRTALTDQKKKEKQKKEKEKEEEEEEKEKEKKEKEKEKEEEEEEQQEEKDEEEPVKETVNKVFTALEQRGWISEQYNTFQKQLDAADYFQEEKLD